jgi:zinc protease
MAAAVSFELDGIFAAGAVMSPFSRGGPQVTDALLRQVERLRAEPVTDAELLKAKNQMLFTVAAEMRTAASRARALGTAAVLEGDPARVNRRLDRVRAVTAADLQRVARQYLAPEHAVRGAVEQNLLGSLLGRKPSAEESAPVTAEPETGPPPKVKAGLTRPADFPARPPSAAVLEPARPAFERFVLPNGLRVVVVPRPGVPYVSTELALTAGAWSEAKPGTASLATGMLTKGTAKHSEKELADELETYAISLGGSAQADSSHVIANSLSDHWPRAVALLAEVVRSPTFPEAEFAKLRKQVLSALAIANREPATKADRELGKRLFGAHPYGRTVTGEPDDVQAVTVDDMKAWWQTAARPDQAVLLISGDVEPAAARRLAETAFGDWQVTGTVQTQRLPDPPAAGPTHIYLVDQPGAIQSQIRIAQRGPRRDDAEYPGYRVISDYFGGSFSSRLNEVIRVQKGLTYGARGGFMPARFDGRFLVSTFSKTESTAAAVKAALGEIARLRTEPPSEQELADTKANFAGKLALARETPQQIADELWSAELHGLPADHLAQTLARAAKVGPEECLRLARAAVDPTKLVVVVVGSAEKLKADLEAVAPVTVVK